MLLLLRLLLPWISSSAYQLPCADDYAIETLPENWNYIHGKKFNTFNLIGKKIQMCITVPKQERTNVIRLRLGDNVFCARRKFQSIYDSQKYIYIERKKIITIYCTYMKTRTFIQHPIVHVII